MRRLEHQKLERVQYWQGQLLRAEDFREIAAVEAQRRWWHNRAIHNAYGVREGFRVELTSAPLYRALVSPGLAYDCFGRELLLEKPQFVPLPTNLPAGNIGGLTLLICYCPPRCDLRSARIPEVCLQPECAITSGTVTFAWKITRPAAPGVPAGCVAIGVLENFPSGDALPVTYGKARFSPTFRRAVPRPLARPLLVSGATVPGNTAWVPWSTTYLFDGALTPAIVGVQTVVDTSSAGFTDTPYYFASLQGPVWNAQSMSFLPAFFFSISDETTSSFTFNIWLQDTSGSSVIRGLAPGRRSSTPIAITNPAAFFLFAQQQKLFVRWTGCQMPNSSPAAFDQTAALDEMLITALQANLSSGN